MPAPPFPAGEAVPAAQLAAVLRPPRPASSSRRARASGAAASAWSTLILRSLTQAQLRARRPRPLRPGRAQAYLQLHVAHPPLPRPRRAPGAAASPRGGRVRARRRRARDRPPTTCSTRERELSRAEPLAGDDIAALLPARPAPGRRGLGSRRSRGDRSASSAGGLFVRFGDVFEGFLSSRRLGGERFEVSEHEPALVGEATRNASTASATRSTSRSSPRDRLTGKVDLAPALPTGRSRQPLPAAGRRGAPARAAPPPRPRARDPPPDR